MSHKHASEMTEAEKQQVLDAATELAPEFAEVSQKGDEENALQMSLVPLYKEAGLANLVCPKKYGGKGGDILTATQVSRILGGGDPSSALAFNMHQTMVGITRGMFEGSNPEGGERWLTMIGNDQALLSGIYSEERAGFVGLADTTAVPQDNGGWVINGKKVWGTLSEACDLITFNATIVDENGEIPGNFMDHAMAQQVFICPMDSPGISIERTWDAMGMRGTGTQTVVFEDVVLEPENLVGNFQGDLYANFEWAAMTFSGVYLGAIDKAFLTTREILRTKSLGATAEGADVQLKGVGFIQSELGEMFVLREASERILYHTCEMLLNQEDQQWETFPTRMANLEVAKLTVTENALRVADLAIRAVGGSAYRRGHVLERLYRDVRSGPFHPLTTAQIYDFAGRNELGLMDAPEGAEAEPASA